MDINKEFVPYEEALAMKELGFDEMCLAYYNPRKEFRYMQWPARDDGKGYPALVDIKNSDLLIASKRTKEEGRKQEQYMLEIYDTQCTAPLWQQAFRWFRRVHKLNPTFQDNAAFGESMYEELQLAHLRELIKIVKNENVSIKL